MTDIDNWVTDINSQLPVLSGCNQNAVVNVKTLSSY